MKFLTTTPTLLSLGLAAILITGCANNGSQSENSASVAITEQSTELEKVGYSYGYMMAKSNKEMVDDLDLDTFEAGFRDAYADKEAPITEAQMEEILKTYETKKVAELQEKALSERQGMAVKNKEVGDKYLTENANKPDVATTESGLQYKVIKEGTGKSPSSSDMVKVHYEGKLIDGTVFDSSYKRGEPAVFAVQQMIPGFSEGLELTKEGGKYEFTIPADLAYGETGNPAIEPNSTLIFTVEMLEVNPEVPKAP